MSRLSVFGKISRWLGYFRAVGDRIHMDIGFFKSGWAVFKIYVYFLVKRIGNRLSKKVPTNTIAFHPQPAGPWYTIWMALQLTPLKIISDYNLADYVFVFDDETISNIVPFLTKDSRAKTINQNVHNIGKDYVGEIFEDVFGYSISIDPTKYDGRAVCKSDINGTHDGIEIACPIKPSEVMPGCAYQRLVDSTFNGKSSEDLRIAYVFGEIALVYHKHKALDKRFGTNYLSTDVKLATDVFSSDEISLLIVFCERMGLDFGAVDVMRDKSDDRLYIVDVNKTCMPVLSLKHAELVRAMQIIADAFMEGLPAIAALPANDLEKSLPS
jgi:hypothetical protein